MKRLRSLIAVLLLATFAIASAVPAIAQDAPTVEAAAAAAPAVAEAPAAPSFDSGDTA